MPDDPQSSRLRFQAYRRRTRGAKSSKSDVPDSETSRKPKHRSVGVLVRRFFELLAGHRRTLAFILTLLTFSTLLKLAPPAVTKLVIDYVLPGKPLPKFFTETLHLPLAGVPLLAMLGGALVVVALAAMSAAMWGRWLATRMTKRVQVDLRKRVFAHAVRLPLHRVYALKSGGVAGILREDAGGVAELIFSMLFNPWRAIIQLLGGLCVLAWVDWRLLLGSLLVIPAVFLTHRAWINRIRPQYREVRRQRQEIDAHATEAFGGMRIVRAFGRSRSETNRFTRNGNLMARHELLAWWWMRGVEIVWDILLPLASAGLLIYGGSQVMAGSLSVGDLMMFLVYLAMLLEPLSVLAESATGLQNNLAGLDRVLDLLEEPRDFERRDQAAGEADSSTSQPETPKREVDRLTARGAIHLRGVGFHYPGNDRPVLSDIELDVPAGSMVALVGPSGAGKTTLCNLVARFYDPTAGAVELDGTDLRELDVESYRRLLGLVEQDVFLFDGTIGDNIGYGARHASQADIERAARIANAHDFITALPAGYDSLIGERGVKLSGGQRQRLAIARAVLADPLIFILDEATSNLDTESEQLIQQSLRTLLRGRTSFVIAHRLSTIVHADLILVMVDGRIVERGTHKELLTAGGRYRTMIEMQMGLQQPHVAPASPIDRATAVSGGLRPRAESDVGAGILPRESVS
jgi:ATP-binding cassette subfamily B protein